MTLVFLPLAVVTAAKGKWVTFLAGFLVAFAWLAGALRLAKPRSRWARRFYTGRKRRRAEERTSDRLQLGVAVAAFLIGAVAVVGLVAASKAYVVPSPAMEPTIHCAKPRTGCSGETSDRVLAFRFVLGRAPERGDIVTFRSTKRFEARCAMSGVFVRRIVGLPGERIESRGGALRVNGKPLEEPYARRTAGGPWSDAVRRFGPRLIPPGHYFLLGDHRGASCDSFVWGSLPRRNLVGKVVAIYWPPGRVGRP